MVTDLMTLVYASLHTPLQSMVTKDRDCLSRWLPCTANRRRLAGDTKASFEGPIDAAAYGPWTSVVCPNLHCPGCLNPKQSRSMPRSMFLRTSFYDGVRQRVTDLLLINAKSWSFLL